VWAFFALAARSTTRQTTFRKVVAAHLILLAGVVWLVTRTRPGDPMTLLGHLLLVAGVVEGAVLVGWRLTQLPKSQALEFLLVSPLRPRRLLLNEALVGLVQLALVTLATLPVLLPLVVVGYLDPLDPGPLLVVPFTWGAVTGLGLTVWAYEPLCVRRWGERVVLGLILVYLVVGVLAGENLRLWLGVFPESTRVALLRGFYRLHTDNPFGTLQWWLEHDIAFAWEKMLLLQTVALAVIALLLWRAASRLERHFHELHYQPVADVSAAVRPEVGNRPLTWWAVRRVGKYGGRINLWLAGAFCLLYAAYLLAGDRWPSWMGRRIFTMCDGVGGPAGLTTALVLLAAVPAAFQYGLWDSSVQNRCRRLELLLLTRLGARDYWHAAASAAWNRGWGYLGAALLLWGTAWASGRISAAQVALSLSAAVLLWCLYFALGFRAFAHGKQANGLGSFLTLGLPLLVYACSRLPWPALADAIPPGMVFRAGVGARPSTCFLTGAFLAGLLAVTLTRQALASCEDDLRRWYDDNAGSKVLT
jgi:hypothetical protein